MSWSYSTALATDKDQVRFLIGDIDTADQLLSDEEIAGLLTMQGSVNSAAARAAASLANVFVRKANELKDDLGASVKYSDRAAHFRSLALGLWAEIVLPAVTIPISTSVSTPAVW